jgi:hypothetical protein
VTPSPKPRHNGWKNTSCARSMPVVCRADTVPGWRFSGQNVVAQHSWSRTSTLRIIP